MIALRPFEPDDLNAVCAVTLATGDAGMDASHLYEDPMIIGAIYSAPYAALRPDLMLVAADELGVVGYVTGALDTAAWEARLEREWWPPLRQRYPEPSDRPRPEWTADQWRAFQIHHPAPTPPAIVQAYPAHLHMNLLQRAQRQGVGSRLLAEWWDLPACRDLRAAHVGVSRGNAGGLRFWASRGFETLSLGAAGPGRTVWMGRRGAS